VCACSAAPEPATGAPELSDWGRARRWPAKLSRGLSAAPRSSPSPAARPATAAPTRDATQAGLRRQTGSRPSGHDSSILYAMACIFGSRRGAGTVADLRINPAPAMKEKPRSGGVFCNRSVPALQARDGSGSPRAWVASSSVMWANSERLWSRQVIEAESSRSIRRSPGSDWLPRESLR